MILAISVNDIGVRTSMSRLMTLKTRDRSIYPKGKQNRKTGTDLSSLLRVEFRMERGEPDSSLYVMDCS